jgi:hypothetical protein
MTFHLDGSAHPKVVKQVESFEWHHGPVFIDRRSRHTGLPEVQTPIETPTFIQPTFSRSF